VSILWPSSCHEGGFDADFGIDSHFRVGGAIGSNLQKETCAKKSGRINPECKAASMLLHLKPESTAYLENVWAWVADHDLDKSDRP
jgi:hypothetical protein